jgi:DNA invertase Pin-like site-specific DNA recombinase
VRLSAAAFPPQCGKTVLPIVDTSMAAGKCFLDMLGVFAEFETNLRRERQLEGIAKAKAAGVYKGRPASIDAARCAN